MTRPRIAVVGAGIAGMSAAWLLRHTHDVTLYEAESRAGGHADTQIVAIDGRSVAVDTGFIVYNATNYPNLTGLFAALGVETTATDMSFGVSMGNGAMEYAGGELHQLFAQKRNLARPRFWAMLRDIVRFYRQAPALLAAGGTESLGTYLDRNKYGPGFIEDHILPMGAAIWSASIERMRAFPVRHFVRFFHNHGLLRLTRRPAWRSVAGGSRMYVNRLLQDLPDLRLAQPVLAVRQSATGPQIITAHGAERYDQVILACHADQALALLEQPNDGQRAVLGAITCDDNLAILHTDISLMPRRRRAWSAWNYISGYPAEPSGRVSVTYWMNRLQCLGTDTPVLVSLNPHRAPEPGTVLLERRYRHPQFDAAATQAQAALPAIQGQGGLWFAGAWTGWGFHEDGIASAVRIAAAMGVAPPWQPGSRAA